jgi:hypothetical protein
LAAQKHREELRASSDSVPNAGYIQRLVEMATGSALVEHDGTVRKSQTGEIIQFRFGGTGYDSSKLLRVSPDRNARALPFDAYEIYHLVRRVTPSRDLPPQSESMPWPLPLEALVESFKKTEWLDEQKLEWVLSNPRIDVTDGEPDPLLLHLQDTVNRIQQEEGATGLRSGHGWFLMLIQAHRRAFVPAGTMAGVWTSNVFLPDMVQMAISLHKHTDKNFDGAATADEDEDESASRRVTALLTASREIKKPQIRVRVETTEFSIDDYVEHWQRQRLGDWSPEIDVRRGHPAHPISLTRVYVMSRSDMYSAIGGFGPRTPRGVSWSEFQKSCPSATAFPCHATTFVDPCRFFVGKCSCCWSACRNTPRWRPGNKPSTWSTITTCCNSGRVGLDARMSPTWHLATWKTPRRKSRSSIPWPCASLNF